MKKGGFIFGKIAEKKLSYLREITSHLNFESCRDELLQDPLTASLLDQMSKYEKKIEIPKQKTKIEE